MTSLKWIKTARQTVLWNVRKGRRSGRDTVAGHMLNRGHGQTKEPQITRSILCTTGTVLSVLPWTMQAVCFPFPGPAVACESRRLSFRRTLGSNWSEPSIQVGLFNITFGLQMTCSARCALGGSLHVFILKWPQWTRIRNDEGKNLSQCR